MARVVVVGLVETLQMVLVLFNSDERPRSYRENSAAAQDFQAEQLFVYLFLT